MLSILPASEQINKSLPYMANFNPKTWMEKLWNLTFWFLHLCVVFIYIYFFLFSFFVFVIWLYPKVCGPNDPHGMLSHQAVSTLHCLKQFGAHDCCLCLRWRFFRQNKVLKCCYCLYYKIIRSTWMPPRSVFTVFF